MVKSSVPRGESSSRKVFDTEIATARPYQGAGRPLAAMTHTQRASELTKHAQVPATDLRLTSPIPHTRSRCLPNNDPTISEEASARRYEPQIRTNSVAKVLGGKWATSWMLIGTITNLKRFQSVVISRQFARASWPSIRRDCAP